MKGVTELTLGTHNLHDETGRVGGFADVLILTEAIPLRVRAALVLTHRVYVCRRQRDLVIALRRGLFGAVRRRYEQCHPGEAGFTPHRGTFWLETAIAATGQPVAVVAHHRINAAFPPFRFPESEARRVRRRRLWLRHDTLDLLIVSQLLARGFEILAGGDGNRREGAQVWPESLNGYGEGTDRLAVSGGVEVLGGLEDLGRHGSDHPRKRLRLRLFARVNDKPEAAL